MSGTSPVKGDSDGEDLRTRPASHGLMNEAVILALRKQQQLQIERQQLQMEREQEQQQLLLEQQYQHQEQMQREQQLQQEEQMRESSDGSPPCAATEIPSPPPPSSLPPPPTTTILSAVTSLAGPVFSVIGNQIITSEDVDVDQDMTERVTDEDEVSESLFKRCG